MIPDLLSPKEAAWTKEFGGGEEEKREAVARRREEGGGKRGGFGDMVILRSATSPPSPRELIPGICHLLCVFSLPVFSACMH